MSSVLAFTLLAALSQSPARLAAPGLQVVNLDAAVGDFYNEHLAQQLKYAGVTVVTNREIASILGLERQRALLGCSIEGCVAELANALGADGVLMGDIAKLGTTYQLNLKVVASGSGKTVALASATVRSEDELLAALTNAARQLAVDASRGLGKPEPTALGERGPKRYWWIPFTAGAVLVAAATVSLAVALDARQKLSMGMPGADGLRLKSLGQTTEPLAFIGYAAGAAGLVAAGLLFFLGTENTVRPAVVIAPSGAMFGLTGALP